MINLPVGSIVKGFAKLGLQKKENWARGTYLGNNKVEFWTGAVLTLEDRNIKEYRRIESNSTVQSDFINSSWEALKDNVQQAVSAFSPMSAFSLMKMNTSFTLWTTAFLSVLLS